MLESTSILSLLTKTIGKVDRSIRRYRARFCNGVGLFPSLTPAFDFGPRLGLARFVRELQTDPLPVSDNGLR